MLAFRASGVTHEDVLHDAVCRVFVLEIPPRWLERLGEGNEVHYHQFVGGHDALTWPGTIADAIIELLGG
jgi:hypothetical protein